MQRGLELSYFAYGNGRLEVFYSRMRGKEGKEKDKKRRRKLKLRDFPTTGLSNKNVNYFILTV